ncbi:hypothetical protein GCM10011491_37130 [Brucella endophytica]|uniref:Uncharacterized protein n=1 Tax=Brucella endophytica TaxID=1963359 RepID=A0A916SLX6_9HYPH|nr:hypothetical protein [Brucella endophytica]GGB05624.1 hypothetical protein GCM10011491_37130 [Brucella endophytica]
MKIEVSHHIDASEPDAEGFHTYHYEYDVYRFSDGDTTYLGRAYTDEPDCASFQGRSQAGRDYRLTTHDLHHPLFNEAAEHLRKLGKTNLSWLKDRVGYVSIDCDRDIGPVTSPSRIRRWLCQLRGRFSRLFR